MCSSLCRSEPGYVPDAVAFAPLQLRATLRGFSSAVNISSSSMHGSMSVVSRIVNRTNFASTGAKRSIFWLGRTGERKYANRFVPGDVSELETEAGVSIGNVGGICANG